MINRDGKPQCSWCGESIPETPGHTIPECCSESCAKDYAYDMRRPKEWLRYCTPESLTPCTRCRKHNSDPDYRLCPDCRASYAERMRERRQEMLAKGPRCSSCGKERESNRYRWCRACMREWRNQNAPLGE